MRVAIKKINKFETDRRALAREVMVMNRLTLYALAERRRSRRSRRRQRQRQGGEKDGRRDHPIPRRWSVTERRWKSAGSFGGSGRDSWGDVDAGDEEDREGGQGGEGDDGQEERADSGPSELFFPRLLEAFVSFHSSKCEARAREARESATHKDNATSLRARRCAPSLAHP